MKKPECSRQDHAPLSVFVYGTLYFSVRVLSRIVAYHHV